MGIGVPERATMSIGTKKMALLASCALAFPVFGQTTHSQVASARPPGVPAEFVITPHGYFHPSCVLELSEGAALDKDDNIVNQSGTARPLATCRFPHFHRNGANASAATAPATGGYAAETYL